MFKHAAESRLYGFDMAIGQSGLWPFLLWAIAAKLSPDGYGGGAPSQYLWGPYRSVSTTVIG